MTMTISERDMRMLELLARGDSSKEIAKKLGYKPGTTRVYMHDLYRKLGVANRSAAAAWYFNRFKAPAASAAQAGPAKPPALEESVGDMAVRTDLLTALGAMSMFLGPYGKLWQVAARLKGAGTDPQLEERRAMSRSVWEALLKGDFAFGKRLCDGGSATTLAAHAPADAVLLAALLLLGGYTHAADRISGALNPRKRGTPARSGHELLPALADAVHSGKKDALERLHALASSPVADPARHVATAVLFHVYVMRGELDHARHVADTLWSEAEGSRQHLDAMGERTFRPGNALPTPPVQQGARAAGSGRREKVTAR